MVSEASLRVIKKILQDLQRVVKELDYPSTDPVLSIPKNSNFGDYSTNLALQLAKLKAPNVKQNPIEIANQILEKLGNRDYLGKAEVAGGGFINFFISDKDLLKNAQDLDLYKTEKNEKILVEYGHVNPLKEIHIGHLRTFILGESICRTLESLGNEVFRANYQGDIGLHIAKAIWGIRKLGLPTKELNLEEKAEYLGKAYALGVSSYEEAPEAKEEIDKINVGLYKLSLKTSFESELSNSVYKKDPDLKEVYELARKWSLEYFEPIYETLGVKYDRCFFESEVFEKGKQTVLDNIGKVFEENEGAVIFPGEKYGLQTRVFITSKGNPTYEGKELGLAEAEYDAFNYERSIHVVASEQEGYFQVVIKAIDLIFSHLKGKKQHLSYGVVDLKEGKMSSRTGNVVTVDDLIGVVSEKVREVMKASRIEIDQEVVRQISLGAIKFHYLKFSPRPNIVFDLDQSVSLDGDSGPYVQYTYARIQSVLKKGKEEPEYKEVDLEKQERSLLRSLNYFPEIVEEVGISNHPNLLASYLVEIARQYNLFYQECRIVGSEKEAFRLKLSQEVGKVIKKGLYLLGIEAPERM